VALAWGAGALLVTMSACSGAPEQPPKLPPPVSSTGPVSVTLSSVPDGNVELSWDEGTRRITAAVTMSGFAAKSAHALRLVSGACTSRDSGQVLAAFPDVVAGISGVMQQRVYSGMVNSGIVPGSHVSIYSSPAGELGHGRGSTLACVNIPADLPPTGPATLLMRAPTHGGNAREGTATLTYSSSARTLRVDVKASGLKAKSSYVVDIRSGSCATQGEHLLPVPELTTDSDGDGSASTTLNEINQGPQSSGWYLLVQQAAEKKTSTDDQDSASATPAPGSAPVLCGDVKG
jgi:hypothetical protein